MPGTLEHAAGRRRMIERDLLPRGVSQRVAEAMGRVPRELFLPDELAELAYDDSPLPLALGQTVSQPYVVATICQLAKVRPGMRVLDVGSGSGYQAAVLCELGAEVFSIERIPELAELARLALASAGYGQVKVYLGDGSQGLPAEAPFDAIVAAAASPQIPRSFLEQLKPRGRAVLPLGDVNMQRLVVLIKRAPGSEPLLFRSIAVRFVPMLGVEGYTERKEEET